MLKVTVRWFSSILAVSLVLLLCNGAARADRDRGIDPAPEHGPHIFSPKGSHRNTLKLLIDHGGLVLPSSNAYAIYWGDFGSSDIADGLSVFFGGFGGSSYSNILTQYMRETSVPQTPPSSTYQVLGNDPSAPPSSRPSVSTILNEACGFISGTPDPEGVYFVITSSFPSHVNYCAWHSYGTCNGVLIPVVYLPNPAGVRGCDITSLSSSENSFSNGAQSIANLAAHEYSEVITDTDLNAWYDSTGQEVGDKCAWQFGAPVQLSNGSTWQLQEEWSNANLGCVQSIPLQ